MVDNNSATLYVVKKTLRYLSHQEDYFVVLNDLNLCVSHSQDCSEYYADIDQLAKAAARAASLVSVSGVSIGFLFPPDIFLIEKHPNEFLFYVLSSLSIRERESFLEKFTLCFFDMKQKDCQAAAL